MIDYFAGDSGLFVLAILVIATAIIGLLVSVVKVLPSAWTSLKATDNRENGRRVYAKHLWRQALAGTLILCLYLGVALDILFVEESGLRSAIARLGVFFALLLTVFRNLDVTYTQRQMGFARAKQLEAQAGEVVRTTADTNARVRRMERGAEEANLLADSKADIAASKQDIAAGKQDTAAGEQGKASGKQDVAAEKQQTDLDLSRKTKEGVDRMEKKGKEDEDA